MTDERKKILFVITHLALGGAQKHLLGLMKSLDPKEYCLHLITSRGGYMEKEFSQITGLTVYGVPQLQRALNPIRDCIAFAKIFRYIKKHRFDIVHTHSPKASLLSRWAAYAAGVKTIFYTVHGWPFHRWMNCVGYTCYLFLEKLSAPVTTRIITVSRADFKTGLTKKIAAPPKLTLIHCGVDVDFCNTVFSQRTQEKFSSPVIITVASLKKQKGLFLFIAMAKEVIQSFPETTFYIIGEGPLRGKITRKIKKCHLERNVFLTGWQDDLSFFYRIASVVVLTSRWEGLPLALIEAVLCGIPVLITDTGGVHDIVRNNEQGKIISLKDTGHIGKECTDMLRDLAQWNIMVEENRKNIRSDDFSETHSYAYIRKIYETIASCSI